MNDKAWSTCRLISAPPTRVVEARRRCCPSRSARQSSSPAETQRLRLREPGLPTLHRESDAPRSDQQPREDVERRRLPATGRPTTEKNSPRLTRDPRGRAHGRRASLPPGKTLVSPRASIWPPASRMTDFPLEEVEQPVDRCGKQENQQRQRENVDNVVNFHRANKGKPDTR